MPPELWPLDISTLDRMVRAVEKVRERLLRATAALEADKVPYAVTGGNAVAVWVARVDSAAVRNTPEVNILLRRVDLEAAKIALTRVGFVHLENAGVNLFLDGPQGRPREAVYITFATEKFRPDDLTALPDVIESEAGTDFRVVTLEALVRMKLTSFRNKDRMHLRDLLDIGLIDQSWVGRLPNDLDSRLQQIIDTPGG